MIITFCKCFRCLALKDANKGFFLPLVFQFVKSEQFPVQLLIDHVKIAVTAHRLLQSYIVLHQQALITPAYYYYY